MALPTDAVHVPLTIAIRGALETAGSGLQVLTNSAARLYAALPDAVTFDRRLSVIIDAIKEGRKIFQRMNSHASLQWPAARVLSDPAAAARHDLDRLRNRARCRLRVNHDTTRVVPREASHPWRGSDFH